MCDVLKAPVDKQRSCVSGVCAAAGVVNQADDKHLQKPGYFTTPGWHRTTDHESKGNGKRHGEDTARNIYLEGLQLTSKNVFKNPGTQCLSVLYTKRYTKVLRIYIFIF